MALCVTFVSGIRKSGKSMVIQTMVEKLWKKPPHYIRLVKTGSGKSAAKSKSAAKQPTPKCNVASARWIDFTEDRVFEMLPEALEEIHREDRYGAVVIEADAEPSLRFAYPYDHRVFVMPRPASMQEVFRDPRQAASELRHALDDTAAFASEIFGLLQGSAEDSVEASEDRPELSGTNMRGFLYSPLGDELVTRVQLQQAYHGLVESDVVVVAARGPGTPESDECLRRIDGLLARIRSLTDRRGEMFVCDPLDESSKDFSRMIEALQPMCLGGK